MFLKRLSNFLNLNLQEKSLFAEALCFSVYIKIYLIFVPYRKWSEHIGERSTQSPDPDLNLLLLVRKAVQRAEKFTLWKNQCLVMSLATKQMLKRRNIPSVLHLGLQLDEEKKLLAHAWLEVNGFEMVKKQDDYLKIASTV